MSDRAAPEIGRAPSIFKSAAGRDLFMRWYDARIEGLPIVVESRVVPTPVGRTHVLVAGPIDAPPVVVLHGMNMNAVAMEHAVKALSKTYRVYAIDIIGMPGKSEERRLPRAGVAYPQWLVAVMDQLDLERARFVGLSFGGWLILKLGSLAPERIMQGVLLDAGGLVPFTLRGQMVSGVRALRYMWQPRPNTLLRAVQPFYAPGQPPDPPLLELLGLGYRHVRLDVDLKGLPPLRAMELRRMEAPFLVLYGEHDIFFDVRRALERAREIIPHVDAAEIIPNEGHVMSRSGYALVYEKIQRFFAGYDRLVTS